jgi:hypothetical protein
MSTTFDDKMHWLLAYHCFDPKLAIKQVEDGLRLTTHCMYPSNGRVQVTVRGGTSTVVASDEGGALGEALAAGIPMKDFSRQLAHLVRDQGLLFKDGVIFTPQMPIGAAPLAVLLVANASQEIARWLYEHMKIKRSRDFKKMLAAFLKETFDDRVTATTIVGHSHKAHKFANVISFANGTRLIVDPVANEPSSINARVVANLDVKATNDPLIDQRIVYDDEEEWTPADLNLLQVGAFAVPFSRSSEVIGRLAAGAQQIDGR